MASRPSQLALLAALLLAAACAESEVQPAQPPPPPVAAPVAAVTAPQPDGEGEPAQAAAGPHGGLGPHQRRKGLPPVGPAVRVTLDGQGADIALASLAAAGSPAPTLAQLWKAAYPAVDPAALRFDLAGSDGFRASARPRCARRMTGAELASAHIDPTSHDVTFDPGVELPHCFHVMAVVSLDATR